MVVRFGLIGCGFISRKHLRALASCKGAQLVAICDLHETSMDETRMLYQTISDSPHPIKYHKDYKKMLADPQIDAVIITSFSGLHARMATDALHLQKHVVLEKPMALSIEECNELITLAQKQQRELMVCHQLRFRPVMQTIKRMIDGGELGKPYLGVSSIRINRTPDYYSAAAWRGKWSSDGGMLINQGIHLVDLLQWFLGDVYTVYGEIAQSSRLKETEDVAVGIIHFKNNAKGIVEANIVTKPNNLGYSLTIFCERGTISIEGPTLNQISRWYVDGEHMAEEELVRLLHDENEEVYMYEDFIEAVNSKDKHVLIDGTEGKKALEIIFAMYQSELSNQVIHVPLSSFSTTDMCRREGN
jgi:predicted dehydrogenase